MSNASTEKSSPPAPPKQTKGYVQPETDLEIKLLEWFTNRDQISYSDLLAKMKESEGDSLKLLTGHEEKPGDNTNQPLNLSRSPKQSPKPRSNLEKDLEEKGLLCRVKIGRRVTQKSAVKVSDVRYQDSDVESDKESLSAKELRQKQ